MMNPNGDVFKIRPEYQLVILGGHGICVDPVHCFEDRGWIGIFPGEAALLVAHVKRAFEEAAALPNPILVLSGGITRVGGSVSEAAGMLAIAEHFDYWGHRDVLDGRVLLEEYATDSMLNVAWSLAVAYRHMRYAAAHVYCVGWAFKGDSGRFPLHLQILGIRRADFTYIGVNNPVGIALEKAIVAEHALVEVITADPYMKGAHFILKRLARNPLFRFPDHESDPEIGPMMKHIADGTFRGPYVFTSSR